MWGAAGVTVVNAVNSQDRPVIGADGSGGVIIGWEDSRTTATPGVDIHATRLDGARAPPGAADGIVVCTAAGQQGCPGRTRDGAGRPPLGASAAADDHPPGGGGFAGGSMPHERGASAVPTGGGLGVRLDRDKLGQYAELYRELGGYAYDRDPGRPGWYAMVPGQDYARPPTA